jgi:hypothetical protein
MDNALTNADTFRMRNPYTDLIISFDLREVESGLTGCFPLILIHVTSPLGIQNTHLGQQRSEISRSLFLRQNLVERFLVH